MHDEDLKTILTSPKLPKCIHNVELTQTCHLCGIEATAPRDVPVLEQPGRQTPIYEGSHIDFIPHNTQGVMDPADTALFMPDNVMHPPHYVRWSIEPIEFIATNDMPWWMANVVKYIMRYDAKDGLQDLYKARSYLEMKIRQLEGVKRFWDKPVNEERTLNADKAVRQRAS